MSFSSNTVPDKNKTKRKSSDKSQGTPSRKEAKLLRKKLKLEAKAKSKTKLDKHKKQSASIQSPKTPKQTPTPQPQLQPQPERPVAVPHKIPTASVTSAVATLNLGERRLYWCQRPGISAKVQFKGNWILELTDSEGYIPTANNSTTTTTVLVPALCPFHVIATIDNSSSRVLCSGCNTHKHEDGPGSIGSVITDISNEIVLNIPLVTQPMPLDILIKSPELRTRALYFFIDTSFKQTYPHAYAQKITSGEPQLVSMPGKSSILHFANPACHRALQHKVLQARIELNKVLRFSIDEWTNVIDNNNMLLFWQGSRVPIPRDQRFRASNPLYGLSMAFMTEFQQQMWKWYLDHDSGACYLDATFSFDKEGYQLWTLFYERHGCPIPVSFLVTTAVSVRLVVSWMEELVSRIDYNANKILFVNSISLCDQLAYVFSGWDIRFGKYYVTQGLRATVLRSHTPEIFTDNIRQAVAGLRYDYRNSMKDIVRIKTLTGMHSYIFDHYQRWDPQTPAETREFEYSLDAISRWRYLLWSTMLSRPPASRMDSLLYYICREILPDIKKRVEVFPDTEQWKMVPFDMDSAEMGHPELCDSLQEMSATALGPDMFCLATKRELVSKVIVDVRLNVCYCDEFVKQSMCVHLIHCSASSIHQPELIKLLCEIPDA